MKKTLLFPIFLISFLGFSQYNINAPWIKNNAIARSSNITIDESILLFDEYWTNHDKDVKGSGYKPFMRWVEHWRNKTNNEGYLITPQEMWDAYSFKKNKVLQRVNSTNAVPLSNWESVGPFTHTNSGSWSSGQGRINTILVDPNNANTIFMGAPAGGIWKSTNSGDNWIPLGDNFPQMGVSGIAIDYNNSNNIYISTGDCDGSNTYSVGVLKSTDGGLTWNTTGLTFTNTSTYSGDILINPTDSNMLWVATSLGIYRTIDAGVNWTLIQSGDFSSGRIRLKPGTTSTVYAVTNNRFYRSTNSGSSFTVITTGLPSSSGRLILDVTPANSQYIYILSSTTANAFQGIYRSIDGGTTWTKTSGTTNIFESTQAYYDLALAVSNTNENEIYTGCLNIWKSLDGGVTVSKVNFWNQPQSAAYTHADIHYLRFYGNKLYCGSDGGIYISDDNATSFTDKTAGAQIGQFYRVAVSKQSVSKMVGGLQDNGGYAFSNNIWKNYYGADGMDTAIHPNNSNLYYGFIQNGNGLYISNNAGNSLTGSIDKPLNETGNWITPLAINSTGELFSCYKNLFKLTDGNWTQQSTTVFSGNSLDRIAIDPSNDLIMYVVDNEILFKSTDKGINFIAVYYAASNITSVDVHSTNSNIIYITTSGTTGETLKSLDGGLTFTAFSQGLPNIGKNVIIHQGRNTNNPLYVGTSLGVFYRDDTLSQWEPFDTNLPNVSVTDLEINLDDAKIVASTYGRGIWQSAIPVQVPLNDVKLVQIISPTSVNVNCNATITPQVQIKNNGSNVINTVNFNYSFNNSTLTYNWNGVINAGQTVTVSLPTATLSKGAYDFVVNSTIANDSYNDNNSTSGTFYLNAAGTVNVTNTFESPSNELLENDEGSSTGIWTRGLRAGSIISSGTNNVYSTSLTGNYPDQIKSFLISECYNLTQLANPQISFKMAFDLENNWDIAYVEYSTDFGQNWEILGTQGANWYNSNRTPQTSGTDCNNCVGAQWTGTDGVIKTYNYSLIDLNAEQNIIFRIVFQSDESVTNQGVIIDDFLISGTLASDSFDSNSISIYPNPSSGIYNITSNNYPIEKIEVYDITGKIIESEVNLEITNNSTVLNLTQVSSGLYFVRISANNQKIIKKIIKK